MSRRPHLAAAALGLLVAALLSRGHRDVGYVRDEGIYFHASRAYADWATQVLADPRRLLDRELRDRAFAVNREHPDLLKLTAGLSARLLSAPGPEGQPPEARAPAGALPLLPEGAAMRLPAQLLAGLGAALLFLAGWSLARRRPASTTTDLSPSHPAAHAPHGPSPPSAPPPAHATPAPADLSPETPAPSPAPPPPPTHAAPSPADLSPETPAPPSSASPPDWPLAASAGLLAALWFIGLPHVWYHAGLHCFDVPVAVLTLAVVFCYRRALASARWGLALGPLLGVAIAVKHNALFIPLLLGVHYLASLALARRRPTRGQLAPLPFLSMALLAPSTALALWPWLWADPLARLAEYFEFHRHHAYYNTEYLGINFNQPPLPWSYPWLLTWATVPTALLLLALLGLALGLRRDLSARTPPSPAPTWSAPLPGPARDGLLYLLFGLFPLALISLPTIPIFGGTKHWLTAYPFLALAAAAAWTALWRRVPLAGRARLLPLTLVPVLLAPALWSTAHGHPYGISQYAPLVGGARGAADLGLLRGFWGGSVLPLLPHAAGERLYPHDLHDLARLQYEREGRWPAGTTTAPIPRASAGLLFHERHMLTNEVDLWNHLGTTAPAHVLTLDDVPLTSLYTTPPR